METPEKTFRYTQIFKNIGFVYLIVLILTIITTLLVVIGVVIGIGVILLFLFLNTSISISNLEITKKTILGTKSFKWSEISRISSRGASLILRKDDITLSFNSQLNGSKEIFDMLYSKRADLFDTHKNNPFVRSIRNNMGTLSIGLLLVILALLLYFIKDYVFTAGYLGLFFCIQAFLSWYSSPRSITLENNSLIVNYLRKSVSIPVDDIESVQIGKTNQEQFKSVLLVFKNKTHMEISGYKQSPLIIYPVLKQWHEKYSSKESTTPA